ncbi:MAG: hypothetical protein NT169_02710 [Chloroflexi bacterium]|nr:hypothetical protein [Chloroflexota bacterium]
MPSSMPLLATKLFIPPPRPTVIARPRLAARVAEGLTRPLTLVSAAARFRKDHAGERLAGEVRLPRDLVLAVCAAHAGKVQLHYG